MGRVPCDIKAELLHTFGISGTDVIENSFNWLREKASRDKAEKQSPMTQWERSMASPFMEAHDKRPSQFSAESDTLKRGICHVLFRGHWGNLRHAWRSLLVMLGWVLYHRTDKIGYFVLQSSRYSCVTWRPCIRSHGSVYFFRLGDVDDATAAEAPWQQFHFTALDEWRVMVPRPLTRVQVERLGGNAASPGITFVFMPGEESKPLLRTVAETAFKALTRHF